MAVNCLQSIGMTQHKVIAITATLELPDAHTARESRPDGIAFIKLDIHPFVHAAAPPAIGRIDTALDGSDEMGKINIFFGRNRNGRLVPQGIDMRIVPRGVEIQSRIEFEGFISLHLLQVVDGVDHILEQGIVFLFFLQTGMNLPVHIGHHDIRTGLHLQNNQEATNGCNPEQYAYIFFKHAAKIHKKNVICKCFNKKKGKIPFFLSLLTCNRA